MNGICLKSIESKKSFPHVACAETFSITSDLAKSLVSLKARIEFNKIEEKEENYKLLIDNLLSTVSDSQLPNKPRLIKVFNYLIEKQAREKTITVGQSYKLILFLLKNAHKKPDEKIEPIKNELILQNNG